MERWGRSFRGACLALGLLALGGVTLWVLLRLPHLPERLPAHFNAAGEIDAWGGRGILWVPLAVGWMIFLVLSVLLRLPGAWNLGVNAAGVQREKALGIARDLLSLLRFAVAAGFAFIAWRTAQCRPLGGWFLPVFLGGTLLPLVGSVLRLMLLGQEK